MENTKRIALVPAYEPDGALLAVLKDLKEYGFDILVVNDGSSEDKEKIFAQVAEYGTVIAHEENMGKGRAVKTGLEYIRDNFPADSTIVTVDADGQHTAKDAAMLADAAEKAPGTLVFGSRKMTEKAPLRSRLGNGITRFIYRVSTGKGVYDTQTGLRAFSASLIPEFIDIEGERYEYEINVLLEAPGLGVPIEEKLIETIYSRGNKSSHFDTVKDSFRMYREILKFSASSILSFLLDYGLFALFSMITAGIGTASVAVSNVFARVISATFNFTVNKRFVFKSGADTAESAVRYFILAAVILIGNTFVLNTLTGRFGVNRYAAKIATEIIFFAISYVMQHTYVFADKKEAVRQ